MNFSELISLPNLISLSRVVIIPPLAWFISRDDLSSLLISGGLVILAGLSDGLDGYLARRMNKISRLGIVLDPIADKLFAAALVIILIIYRDFTIWLAAVIIGRDLLIMTAGALLMRGRDIALPSNLTGKYAFSAVAFLLGAYVIRFEFGIELFTRLSVILLTASAFNYAVVMIRVARGKQPKRFHDRPVYFWTRALATVAVCATTSYKLILYIMSLLSETG